MVWGNGFCRQIAMVAVICSVGLGQRARSLPRHGVVPNGPSVATGLDRPKKVRWYVGVLLICLAFGSHWFLNYANAHGYSNPFPLYLFAASVGAVLWWLTGLWTRWP
jgi:hypothetical protein